MKRTKVDGITVKEYDSLADAIMHASELPIHFLIEDSGVAESLPPTTKSTVVPFNKPAE